MDKVRFSCPRCRTMMQTGVEKVGNDVACPHCAHRFRLVESQQPSSTVSAGRAPDDTTMPPSRFSGPMGQSDRSASDQPSDSSPSVGHSADAAHVASMKSPVVAESGQPSYPRPSQFSCPYCQTQAPPLIKSEVSTVGWVVFAVLFFTTCFGCFVGLLIRDKYRVCSQCKIRLG